MTCIGASLTPDYREKEESNDNDVPNDCWRKHWCFFQVTRLNFSDKSDESHDLYQQLLFVCSCSKRAQGSAIKHQQGIVYFLCRLVVTPTVLLI